MVHSQARAGRMWPAKNIAAARELPQNLFVPVTENNFNQNNDSILIVATFVVHQVCDLKT